MSAARHDYYEVLGVPRTADLTAIRKAYRARARRYHPDVSAAPDAEQRFHELVEAYEVLSRPTARRLYDVFGYRGRPPSPARSDPGATRLAVEDLLRWLSSGGRRRERGVDIVGEVVVRFSEAARGVKREVAVDVESECAACRGAGAAPGSDISHCGSCGGSGRVRRSSDFASGRLLQVASCVACNGTGSRIANPCEGCGGSGTVTRRQLVEVEVPPGAADGERVPVDLGAARAAVAVRVLPLPADSRFVRYASALVLFCAVTFLVLLLAAPETLR